MHFRFLDFLRLKQPPAAVGHMEAVEHQTSRVVRASEEVHDVIREFVHSVNAKRQRDVVREEE
jgi:hypothetical protein